jgi:hypothetical protein
MIRKTLVITVRLGFAITMALFLLAHSSFAQVTGATVQGTIVDASGAAIPGVQLIFRNVGTRVERNLSTNEQGFYQAVNLPPGTYEIEASATGYKKQLRTGLVLTVGQSAQLDLKMPVAGRTESVEVHAADVGVELANSSLKGVVDSRTVRELPLNARDWTQLATLEPGVTSTRTQVGLNSGKAQRGFGTQLTISGGRPQQNNYRLDGISINDYSNGAPGSVLGVDLGVDAVQEFSVITSNYPAEYGRTSGGVVNAITRSGSSKFHGTAYEFLRNSALDARNYFDLDANGEPSKPPFKRNQFGVSGGGPIIKDKTFIFGDYEGLRQSLGITKVVTTPTLDSRNGVFGPVDPTVLRFVNAFYPLPNQPFAPGSATGSFLFSGQQVTHENYYTTRVDHHFTNANTMAGTYVFDVADIEQPDEMNNKSTGFDTRRQIFTLEDTHIFGPRLVNAIRFGISRVVANGGNTSLTNNPAAGDVSYGIVPGKFAPDVLVPGITEFSGGLASISTYHFHWTSIQAYDDAFLSLGSHSLKFGLSFERIRSNETAFTDPTGVFGYSSLDEFLANGAVDSFTATVPNTITPRRFRQTLIGPYIQDDWRVRPNFTVNMGLRYEFATVLGETEGKLATLRNLTDVNAHLGEPMMGNPTKLNFEPRVGFSWDPTRSGKTAVRGAFGIFDVLPLPYQFELLQAYGAPFIQIGVATNLAPGSFAPASNPNSAYNAIFPTQNATLRQTYLDPQPKRNYVMQWNLNLQREVFEGWTAMIGYVGSRGLHQPYRVEDADIVMPTLTSAGYMWPNPIGSGTRLNPNWGQVAGIFWTGKSSYNSFQAKVNKRVTHGFQIGGAYTWAKSLDSSSASLVGDAFLNSISSLPWFDIRRSYGPSDFDIRHNLVINSSWELPGNKSLGGVLGWLTNGYELGAILQASSGTPFTVGFGGDALGLNSTDPTLDVPSVLNTPNCQSLVNRGQVNYVKTECLIIPRSTPAIAANCVQANDPVTGLPDPNSCLNLMGNLGRNRLVGPGLLNLDFSVFKNNKIPRISETFNAQIRLEFFNVLNHTNFAPPTDNLAIFDGAGNPLGPQFGGSGGQITATSTSSRQIQVAVKFIW